MGLGGDGKTNEQYSSPGSVGSRPHILALGLALALTMDLAIHTSEARLSWLSQLGRWKPSRRGSLPY